MKSGKSLIKDSSLDVFQHINSINCPKFKVELQNLKNQEISKQNLINIEEYQKMELWKALHNKKKL